MGNKVTESILEREAMQKVMARILKTQAEFREADLRVKLKELDQNPAQRASNLSFMAMK